jgi:hypothetical protein
MKQFTLKSLSPQRYSGEQSLDSCLIEEIGIASFLVPSRVLRMDGAIPTDFDACKGSVLVDSTFLLLLSYEESLLATWKFGGSLYDACGRLWKVEAVVAVVSGSKLRRR